MAGKKKWEDIDIENREKLSNLRQREIELEEKSGLSRILKDFKIGYGTYAISLFLFVKIRKLKMDQFVLAAMIGPVIPYMAILNKMYLDHDKYKEYLLVKNELNIVIKEVKGKK
jgi:hypothetical protein